MRAITLAIVACLFVGAFCELQPTQQQTECISKLSEPCASGNTACEQAWDEYQGCMDSKCKNPASYGEVIDCAKNTCKTSNSDVAKFQDQYVACVNASIITISLALFAVFAALF